MTPGWFRPINPATLAVSHRSSCVFAQANHDFTTGIVQVANKAIEMKVPVKLLKDQELGRISGYSEDAWRKERLKKQFRDYNIAIDVFHYGFDVDAELRSHVADDYDRRYGDGLGARSAVWRELDRVWKDVVVQKKAQEAAKKKVTRKRCA